MSKLREILENVMYWETCPQDYKDEIKKILEQKLEPVEIDNIATKVLTQEIERKQILLGTETNVLIKNDLNNEIGMLQDSVLKLQYHASQSEENDLKRLYEWLMNENREPAQTKFSSGMLRNVAKEIEFRLRDRVLSDMMSKDEELGLYDGGEKEREVLYAFKEFWNNYDHPHCEEIFESEVEEFLTKTK